MKIGIIGTGNVGGALARAWAGKGHAVQVAARDGAKAAELARQIGATSGGVAETARAAEVIVLAVPHAAAADVIAAAGDLAGKVVLDCTNPFTPDMMGLTVGFSDSGAERIARMAPKARVVKTLNHAFHPTMAEPRLAGQAATLFIAGDDDKAKQTVAGLVESIGFEPVNAGGLANARYLEPLAELLIQLGFVQGMGPGIAIKLLRR